MFRFRKEQMQAFDDAKLPAFEDYMVQHLSEFAERHCKTLEEPGVRKVIKLGVLNSAKYDMSQRASARLYIELMFILGSSFDTDPQLPWASQILMDKAIADEATRTEALFTASTNYHDQVIGADSIHAQNAVRGIYSQAEAVYALGEEDFENQIFQFMEKIYPEKFQHTDGDRLASLIPLAKQLAESISATSHRAVALFVVLMFGFGHGFHHDPLYPWIAKTIENDKSIKDPDERVDRLFKKTQMFLDHMLNYLETT